MTVDVDQDCDRPDAGLRSRLPAVPAARDASSTTVRALHPDYWARPVPSFGDGRRPLPDRRPRARPARRERDRPAVHRRLVRSAAVLDAASPRLRDAGDERASRRRPVADRLPHRERGQVPAAGEQAGARRDPALQRLPDERARVDAAARRDPRARHDRAPGGGRGDRVEGRARIASRTARSSRCRTATMLFDSYHVSRYNTNTGRLTEAMFDAVVAATSRGARRPILSIAP